MTCEGHVLGVSYMRDPWTARALPGRVTREIRCTRRHPGGRLVRGCTPDREPHALGYPKSG